jgi:hypothetical protein
MRVLACAALGAVLVLAVSARSSDPQGKKFPDQAREVLDKAEQLELLGIDDQPKGKKEDPGKGDKTFHGYPVLRRTVVKDQAARKQLLDALYKGIAEAKGTAKCFEPHHGVRATHQGKTVDLVICFKCDQMIVYEDGKSLGVVATTAAPQETLDKALAAAAKRP